MESITKIGPLIFFSLILIACAPQQPVIVVQCWDGSLAPSIQQCPPVPVIAKEEVITPPTTPSLPPPMPSPTAKELLEKERLATIAKEYSPEVTQQLPAPKGMEDIWSKTSNYTVNECVRVCEWVGVKSPGYRSACLFDCRTTFGKQGKPSADLDDFVDMLKNTPQYQPLELN